MESIDKNYIENIMKNYYEEKINADTHPFRKALTQLESDMDQASLQMQVNKFSHEQYIMQQERLFRLHEERRALINIMADDLTSDLVIAKLRAMSEAK